MRLLLDTHALIWWWKDDPILPVDARMAMADIGNEVFVSAATAWELATKVRKGQLLEIRDHIPAFVEHVASDGFHHLPISTGHGLRGGSLPGAHKDPFDRLLAAQALTEKLIVVTCDAEIAGFGCETLW